jgi:hypothetical protein
MRRANAGGRKARVRDQFCEVFASRARWRPFKSRATPLETVKTMIVLDRAPMEDAARRARGRARS